MTYVLLLFMAATGDVAVVDFNMSETDCATAVVALQDLAFENSGFLICELEGQFWA